MKRRWGKTFDTSFYSKFLPRYLCNTDIESSVEIEKYSFFSVSSGAIAFHEDEQYRERLGETTITIHMNWLSDLHISLLSSLKLGLWPKQWQAKLMGTDLKITG